MSLIIINAELAPYMAPKYIGCQRTRANFAASPYLVTSVPH